MLTNGESVCSEYIGMDYSVALRLHLYFYAFRDPVSPRTPMATSATSTALSYDPNGNCDPAYPLDLTRHTRALMRSRVDVAVPEPTRYDKIASALPQSRGALGRDPAVGSKPAAAFIQLTEMGMIA